MILHAGLIAVRAGGPWRGVLVEGASGSGKSDLALRALGLGFRLVADDRTIVFVSGGRLFGRAPDTLKGLIEVRGVGVLARPCLPMAQIVLAVRCVGAPSLVERAGDPGRSVIAGVDLPTMDLWPFEPSAPMKLQLALENLGAPPHRGYQAAGL
jgi:serine kinase of HPr protein (carbohydrate metabolism regulator)